MLEKRRKEELIQYIKKIQEAYHAQGMAICAVDKEGNTLYEDFWGYRNATAGLHVNGDTIFGIASLTKSFTCLSVMQLEARGALAVDEPVVLYLPEFKNQGQDLIKIQNFMSHSAGYYPLPRIQIADIAEKMGIDKQEVDLAYDERVAQEGTRIVLDRLNKQTEYIGKPGEYISYCNDGFGVLAELIHRYGLEKSYVKYVEKNILGPLEMQRTTFSFHRLKQDDNVSLLYYDIDGKQQESDDYYNYHFVLLGGGGLRSTLNDMKKYLVMYLNRGKAVRGERVLDDCRIYEMCRPRGVLRPQTYYGYGLYREELDNITTIRHYGSLPGVSSTMIWSDDLEAGAVVLCNTSNVPVEYIGKAVMRALNGKNPEISTDGYGEIEPEEQYWHALEGEYVADEGQRLNLYKEGEQKKIQIGTKTFPFHLVRKNLGVIYKPFVCVPIPILRREDGTIFALKYNDRIIPKRRA